MLGYQRWIFSHPSCVSNVDVRYVDWRLAINYVTDILTFGAQVHHTSVLSPICPLFRDNIYVRAHMFSKAKLPRSLLIDDFTTTTNRIYYGWHAKNYSFQGSYLRNIYFLFSSIPTIPHHFLISSPDISTLVFLHGQNYVESYGRRRMGIQGSRNTQKFTKANDNCILGGLINVHVPVNVT